MSGLGVTGCRKRARFNVCKLKSECEKELRQGKKTPIKIIWYEWHKNLYHLYELFNCKKNVYIQQTCF